MAHEANEKEVKNPTREIKTLGNGQYVDATAELYIRTAQEQD